MKKILFLFFLSAVITGCGSGRPYGVLDDAQMEQLLWDVAEGGEFVNGYVYTKSSDKDRAAISNKLLEDILKQHKVSRSEFDKSIRYYKTNPAKLKVILDSLSARQTRIAAENLNRRNIGLLVKARDSIQKADSTMKADSLKNKMYPPLIKDSTITTHRDTAATKKTKSKKRKSKKRRQTNIL